MFGYKMDVLLIFYILYILHKQYALLIHSLTSIIYYSRNTIGGIGMSSTCILYRSIDVVVVDPQLHACSPAGGGGS